VVWVFQKRIPKKNANTRYIVKGGATPKRQFGTTQNAAAFGYKSESSFGDRGLNIGKEVNAKEAIRLFQLNARYPRHWAWRLPHTCWVLDSLDKVKQYEVDLWAVSGEVLRSRSQNRTSATTSPRASLKLLSPSQPAAMPHRGTSMTDPG
jgi:hypothetical protein